MPFDIGINFRQTSAYVTDPAGTTYCTGDTYPTTRGGATFGWINSPGGNLRNRSLSVDPRIAGINYQPNADAIKKKWRLDLPASGIVDVYCAIGDAGGGNGTYLEIFDNTSSLGVLVAKGTAVTTFYDASDTGYSAAAWPGSNVSEPLTFTSTTFIFALTPGDSTGSNYAIAHIRAAQTASAITLTGATSTQANTGSTGAITQEHTLTGASSAQANTGSAAGITQTHILTGANSVQGNLGGTGDIALGAVIVLAGADAAQANASGGGVITQTQVLTASASTNSGTSSAVAITQVHVLDGVDAIQDNAAGSGAIGILVPFVGAPSVQGNLSGTGQITRTQTLTGANSVQANISSTGSVSSGTVVEPDLTTGTTTTVRIKKPGIPANTVPWLRNMIEILTGRRGNKITVPVEETLTFSSTPTQAECEALYAYTNKVRAALNEMIIRFDS